MKKCNLTMMSILLFCSFSFASYSTTPPSKGEEKTLSSYENYLMALSDKGIKGENVFPTFREAKIKAQNHDFSKDFISLLKSPQKIPVSKKDKACVFSAAEKAKISPLFLITGLKYEINFQENLKSKHKQFFGNYLIQKNVFENIKERYKLGKINSEELKNDCYSSYVYALIIKDWLRKPSKNHKLLETFFEKVREQGLDVMNNTTFP